MDFKILFSLITVCILSSCVNNKPDIFGDDYLIGDVLSKTSRMANSDGSEQNKIAIFDSTIRKIHLFDLDSKTLNSTVDSVESKSGSDHAILHDNIGNYIVDITEGGFSITNKYNQANINPIKLLGKPLSAAFRPDLGSLVIYDDVGSVGLMQLSPQGEVLKTWVGGSRLNSSEDVTINSGDLLDNGHLITSLSDGRLADIDVNNSIVNKRWMYSIKVTGLPTAKWISKIPGHSDQVFFYSSDDENQKIYLYDLATETILDSYQVQGSVEKASRFSHPHVLVKTSDTAFLDIIYPDSAQIKKIRMPRHNFMSYRFVLSSNMNINQDSFSFIEGQSAFNSDKRAFKKYRLSDMLLASSIDLPTNARLEMSNQFVLALFPSKLGHAISYSTDARSQVEFKFFNRGSLKK